MDGDYSDFKAGRARDWNKRKQRDNAKKPKREAGATPAPQLKRKGAVAAPPSAAAAAPAPATTETVDVDSAAPVRATTSFRKDNKVAIIIGGMLYENRPRILKGASGFKKAKKRAEKPSTKHQSDFRRDAGRATQDADALSTALTKLGFDVVAVHPSVLCVKKRTVVACLQEFFAIKAAAHLVYWHGHGDNDDGSWCFDDGSMHATEFINMWQASVEDPINDRRKLVVIGDTCHSGVWAADIERLAEERAIPTNIAFQAASRADENAWMDGFGAAPHSLLGRSLLRKAGHFTGSISSAYVPSRSCIWDVAKQHPIAVTSGNDADWCGIPRFTVPVRECPTSGWSSSSEESDAEEAEDEGGAQESGDA